MYPEQRARDRRHLVGLVAALVALIAGAVIWGIPHIEQNLAEVSRNALDSSGFESVQVEFSGRDASLTGVLPPGSDDVAGIILTVASQWGVRRVEADLTPQSKVVDPLEGAQPAATTTVAAVPSTPSVRVTPGRDGILLEGTVASQVTAAAINANAVAAYGRAVDDRLMVVPAVGEPAWTTDIATLLRGVGAIGGSLSIADGVLTVTGMAPDEATRSGIVAELLALDDTLTVDNQIEIDVISSQARFAIDHRPGGAILRGVVDSEARADELVRAAELVYGVGSVTSELGIDPDAVVDGFLTQPDLLFQALEGRRLDLLVHADGVYLRGVVPGEDTSAAIADALGRIVAPAPVVNELTVVSVDPATAAAVESINALVGTSVTFESGSATLTADSEALLDEVAAILGEFPDLRGVVEGHTDSVGSEADNLALSEARARSVVRYLVGAGVAAERLTSIGFGESRPIESNDTEAGRSANRRIEFKVEGSI